MENDRKQAGTGAVAESYILIYRQRDLALVGLQKTQDIFPVTHFHTYSNKATPNQSHSWVTEHSNLCAYRDHSYSNTAYHHQSPGLDITYLQSHWGIFLKYLHTALLYFLLSSAGIIVIIIVSLI